MSIRAMRLVLWLLWTLLASAPAVEAFAAEEAQDSVRDEARQLAYDGIMALRENRFADALTFLRQAEERFHAPTHLLYMARALVGLNQLVEAHDMYVAIAIEPVPNYAPAAFHEARRQAAAEAEQLRGRIAILRVALAANAPAQVTVTIDDRTIEAARLAHPVAVTPGEHRVAATGASGERAEQIVTAAVGQSTTVALEFGTDSSSAPAPVPGSSPGGDDGGGGWTVAGALLIATGGAGLVLGGITGGLTLTRAADIEDTCGGDACPTTEQSTVDDAKTLGNVSTALFVAGGVLAAAGVVLLVAAPDDEEASTALAPHVELRASPFGASLSGTF